METPLARLQRPARLHGSRPPGWTLERRVLEPQLFVKNTAYAVCYRWWREPEHVPARPPPAVHFRQHDAPWMRPNPGVYRSRYTPWLPPSPGGPVRDPAVEGLPSAEAVPLSTEALLRLDRGGDGTTLHLMILVSIWRPGDVRACPFRAASGDPGIFRRSGVARGGGLDPPLPWWPSRYNA